VHQGLIADLNKDGLCQIGPMVCLEEEKYFEEWQASDMICDFQIAGVGKEKYCIAIVNRLG